MKLLADPLWRINHLYWIKNADGKRQRFELNWAQKILWDEMHEFNIVLKARQLGITTFYCIYLLDKVLFNDTVSVGIIAHTIKDASKIFRDKLKFAFDCLHPDLRSRFKLVGDSATELSFTNGSSISVGTSLRSQTLQYLHISELGKISATQPARANEILSGSLNTVHSGQHIFIESTAEGKTGVYHTLWERAWADHLSGKKLGPMEFKAFFLPWFREPSYSLGKLGGSILE